MSEFDLISEFSGHGKKSGLNQDAIAETCKVVHRAFTRWHFSDEFGKRSGKPRRKSLRNKVRSLTFGCASKLSAPKDRRIRIPGLGKIRCNREAMCLMEIPNPVEQIKMELSRCYGASSPTNDKLT